MVMTVAPLDGDKIFSHIKSKHEFLKELTFIAMAWGVSREEACAVLLETAVENYEDTALAQMADEFRIKCDCCADGEHREEGSEKT